MSLMDGLLSTSQQRLLAVLLLTPDRSHSLSELIKKAGGGRGAVQHQLEALLKTKLVTDKRIGNQRHFQVNREFPLYPELRSISLKTFGLADRVRDALKPLEDRIGAAFIFGSVAKNQDHAGSDIDLMVIGEVSIFDTTRVLEPVEKSLGRSFHINMYDEDEWQSLRNSPTAVSILKEPKIMLIGDEHSL